MMKRIALSLAAAALAFFGSAPEAAAYHSHHSSTYVSSYARCGCPVYVQRYVAYRDGWGRPVWRTRILPVAHRCGWGRPRYDGPRYHAPRYPIRGGHHRPHDHGHHHRGRGRGR